MLDSATTFATERLPIYLANGVLVCLYWLWDNLALLLGLGCATLCFLYFDDLVQRRAHHASLTGDYPRVAQWTTAVVVAVWLLAATTNSTPVPQIGAAMWGGLILALLAQPQERPATLWRAKSLILLYSLALIAFRLYLWQTARLSPEDWAAIVGSSGEAQRVVAQNRSMVTSIGVWLLWAVMPLTYFSMLLQKVTVSPLSLVSPFRSAAQIVHDLRTRREGGDAW